MDFKNELRGLVEIVKLNAKKAGVKITNEDIAKRMGYSRSHFSTLLGESSKVEQFHVDDFKSRFQSELAGIIKPGAPGDELNEIRALAKMLYQRVAKLESVRLGVPVKEVMDEMDRDTTIARNDLERD